jgi:hypothetical protein
VRRFLEIRVPNGILRVTGPFAFGAPEVPTEDQLRASVRARGPGGLDAVLKEFRDAATEMNARAGTAAPAASFMLTIAAVLKSGLDNAGWLYVALVVLPGLALIFAITCQSVTVAPIKVGLEPGEDDLTYLGPALRRKEAYARLASALAGLSVVLLGVTALASA